MKKVFLIISFGLLSVGSLKASPVKFADEKSLQNISSLQMSAGSRQFSGQTQKISFSIDINQCSLGKTMNGDDIFAIENLKLTGNIGKPRLPVKIIEISLPADTVVSGVEITNVRYREIENSLNIAAFVPQTKKGAHYIPDNNVYGKNDCFPGNIIAFTVSKTMNENLLYIFVYPVQYNPVTKKAILITSGEIDIY